ncbi:transmembrane prolyl 4-hydroxylase isoform X2 [Nematostella vectensis]|uniref:transmembrane prolyl 4-hydroxylase isoform X2 n=1 Tax=Nematostella vectensis TaxID=45351 RepID=UPI00207700CB|nr:transmembrane prolyl 4-hydroxylase isoform X2 [Nematostella vectensis]
MKYLILGLILTTNIVSVKTSIVAEPEDEDTCSSELPCTSTRTLFYYNNNSPIPVVKLAKLDGVRAGHKQLLDLEKGQTHHMITRKVPHFLSDDECDHIIKMASERELYESSAGSYTEPKNSDDDEDKMLENYEDCKRIISEFDTDSDGQLSISEFQAFIVNTSSMPHIHLKEIKNMLKAGNADPNGDGFVNFTECVNANYSAIEKFITDLEDEHPLYRARYSNQTWLPVDNIKDPIHKKIQQRLSKLVQMPIELLEKCEELQVVRYPVSGHFHAHYDSSHYLTLKETLPCCALSVLLSNDSELLHPEGKCHLCRFMTVLYYLNDVTAGGETAFPVADNETFDDEVVDRKGLHNLSARCNMSNLVLKPAKGTAIVFYNHHIDQETGQIGPVDEYSLHGGCDVKEGVKWIATNWINNLPHVMKRTKKGQ